MRYCNPISRIDSKVTITGTKLGESEKAVKFRVDSIGPQTLETPIIEWFPLSQISKIGTDPNVPGSDYLVVSQWIVGQKGLQNRPMRKISTEQVDATGQRVDSEDVIFDDDDIPF